MTHILPPRGTLPGAESRPVRPVWIPKLPDLALCLSGYPIRIRLHVGCVHPYSLEFDGRPPRAYNSLTQAKQDALRAAAEWDLLAGEALAG
ncbi:hypothetical protein [Pseudoroseomonas cervicalis]|uniref:hypothetical protein n=1 Tax=Teichococcus cervicalis TaxID=204525 RepID=UPI0022F17BF2|nr:hypothetical protein [Pseudoroseomonas cervicalis]WBV44264.1 hypothetical protein PFY06_06815 [Pseudoroseomonas cervicalis]